MYMLRKHLLSIAVVLLVAFSFVATELQAGHDSCVSPSSHHCCVQCCPSHNLAPLTVSTIFLNTPSEVVCIVEPVRYIQQGSVLNSIYRPPIA